MRIPFVLTLFLGLSLNSGLGLLAASEVQGPSVKIPGVQIPGVQIKDIKLGDGLTAEDFSKVKVHYSGWLMDGKKFDSSLDRNQPFELMLGMKQVIPGWEQGLLGMKVGGKRELVIPPELGYGKQGAGGVIPPNATLRFEVELLDVGPAPFKNASNEELEALLAKGTKIIDIRRPDEWKQTGVVKGSILLTAFDARGQILSDFPKALSETVGKDEPFILICRTGSRTSAIALPLAEELGYRQIINATRGITSWIKEGHQVRKDCSAYSNRQKC